MASLPPDALICPITNERLVDPVVDPEGNTYERAAILEWLSHNSVSPLTRTPLAAWQLVPNRTLADLLASTGDGTAGAAAVPPTPVQQAPSFELKLDVTHEAAGSTAAVHLEAASDCVSRTHSGRTIVCVLDISYSMDDRATMYGDAEGANGLSLLDIVKHATHTVIDTLEPHDRLGVVVYSSNAQVLYPISPMSRENKSKAWEAVRGLRTTGQTNLWDGLLSALDLCTAAHVPHANILLLTDGQPNIGPPRGHIPSLRAYFENHPGLSVEISTFGFGYNMASRLLHDLAAEGGGAYAFIPDSSFVGTAFVNAVANVLATALTGATLLLDSPDGCELFADFNGLPCTKTEGGGLSIRLPALGYGQPKNILVVLKLAEGANSLGSTPLRARLRYADGKTTEPVVSKLVAEGSPGQQLLLEQRGRLQTVKLIRMSDSRMHKTENSEEALMSVQDSLEIMLQELLDMVPEDKRSPAFAALLEDLQGQMRQAYSRMDWYTRWGKHYLPALARAHALQQCTNFKDPGLQAYAGPKFCAIRDFGESIFVKLPPPTPSLRPLQNAGATAAAPVSMEMYHNKDNPCFAAGDVPLAGGGTKPVAQLAPGDVVVGLGGVPAVVRCVVATAVAGGAAELVALPGGVLVTAYHPLRPAGSHGPWAFPAQLARPTLTPCDTVYSFVLEAGPGAAAMVVGGYEAVSLGHGLTDPVAAHPYLGSSAVLADLATMDGWAAGHVALPPGPARRDPATGLIIRLEQRLASGADGCPAQAGPTSALGLSPSGGPLLA